MRALLALGILTTILGCASTRPCDAFASASASVLLGCQAEGGDKAAQLAMGRRFEEGDGVEPDLDRAASYYRAAARFTSGTTYVYSPPVGKSRGRVIPLRTGVDQAGLAEASYRLGLLYLRSDWPRTDADRARAFLERAARQGSADAARTLTMRGWDEESPAPR